ncbi:serine hydrolase domain-containing protein [Breznakiella homolactica]|uniref:Beta-lactamase family protein n=1 Tax=Breznakiella homolactica TaxID=2798577 RepID=A0A7T7XPG9_9SPIR|nr:serine hydrolase domain-containing protein [Breznakiella homolactica]QQO09982.1 beta-lactamase family protein [Breznakiella homolactica]
MTSRKISGFLLAFLSTFLILSCATGSVRERGPRNSIEKAAAEGAAELLKYNSASVQYALIDGDTVVLSGQAGVYERESDKPLSNTTMYGIGSISKMLTAGSIMMLVDEGLIDLEAPIIKYIPEFTMRDERYRAITVRMLLNHSSGIPGTTFNDGFLFDVPTMAAHDNLLAHLAQARLIDEPGAFSVYCNDGITLLEIITERVSGKSFSRFFAERIAEPLGLKNTKTPADNFDRAQLARIYGPFYDKALPNDVVNVFGSGGFYSTAEETSKIGLLLAGKYPELLSEESAERMMAEEYRRGVWFAEDENTFAYGLGWDSVRLSFFESRYGIRAVTKGGSSLFSNSALVVLPDCGLAAVVATSGGSSLLNTILASRILEEALLEKGIISEIIRPAPALPPAKQPMPESLAAFSGRYATALGHDITIDIRDGGFTLADTLGLSGLLGLQAVSEYVYTGNNEFTSTDGSTVVSFDRPGNGETYLKQDVRFGLPGTGDSQLIYYSGQKLPAGAPLAGTTREAWQARDGQRYFILDDHPASQLYYMPLVSIDLEVNPDSGFTLGCRITGPDTAESITRIPVMFGSMVSDMEFFTQNGTEYLKAKGFTWIGERSIPGFENTGTVTIGSGGFARYFKITEADAGKQITVSVPAGSSFAVYGKDNFCRYFSVVNHEESAVLPEGGKIAFIGRPGDIFFTDIR